MRFWDYNDSNEKFDTEEALQALGRVSSPALSPDKKKILYGISYESVEENRSNNDLYIMNIDGSENTRITKTPKSESNAVWIENGNKIAFLYPNDDGVMQIWTMKTDGSDRKMVSNLEKGINGFVFSPDEKKIVFISNIKSTLTAQDIYSDLPKKDHGYGRKSAKLHGILLPSDVVYYFRRRRVGRPGQICGRAL